MLKQRLEKIVEFAILETSSLDGDDDSDDELESSIQTDPFDEDNAALSKLKVEDDSASAVTDNLPAIISTPKLIPIPEQAEEEDWEDLEQSAIRLNIDDSSCSSGTDDGLLVVQSAPSLTQGQAEQFPSAILSHSTHIL